MMEPWDNDEPVGAPPLRCCGWAGMMDPLESKRCARLLRTVADPERLRIIQCLRAGPKNVSELAALLESEVGNVSHHLGVLRNGGVVQDEKCGRHVVYRLHPDIFQSARGAEYLEFGCCRLQIHGPEKPQE
jgi:ArsR family transcriptional regulator